MKFPFWKRRRRDQELNEEIQTHLTLGAREEMGAGQSPSEAQLAARRQFGNEALIGETTRDMWGWRWPVNLVQDLRYGLRTMQKSPAYSIFAVLTMALGIGSTILMWTIVDSVLLKPLPFRDPHALYMFWQKTPRNDRANFSTRNFLAFAKQTESLDSVAVFTGNGFTISEGGGEPEFVLGQLVSPSFFTTLDVNPSLGRNFLFSEGEAGHNHEVILSDRLWRNRFGGNPDAVGRTVALNGEPYTIVGVMPLNFNFLSRDYQLWVPAALNGPPFQEYMDAHLLRVLGRVKPGVSEQRLQAETETIGKRISEQEQDPNRQYFATSLEEVVRGDLRGPLLVLLFAVTCLLLIACANVANLTLARASVRRKELAVRGALGASRWRLIQQLLTESALLGIIGGSLGVALAYWGLHLLAAFGAKSMPQLADVHADVSMFGFTIAISLISGVLVGLTPALTVSRADFHSSLRDGTRAAGSIHSERIRSALVFVEIALSTVLLICSGLMMRSFDALSHVEPGFRSSGLMSADLVFRPNRYPDSTGILRFYRDALAMIRNQPGIKSAAMATVIPFGDNDWGNSFEVEGQPAPPGRDYEAQIRPISNDYFMTMGIPLRTGREFTERDNESAARVAIINEVIAKQFWPTSSPIGMRVRFDTNWLTIVGVSGNVKEFGLDSDFQPQIYLPYSQLSPNLVNLVGRENNYVVRSATDNATLVPELRGLLRSLDPEMVIAFNPVESLINDSIAQPRFRTWLVVTFSVLAMVLASVGIFGVVSYTVAQRYRDFGIRMALGAERGDILQLVLGRTVLLTLAAIAAGGSGAFLISSFLKSVLFGITVHDPFTYVFVPTLLMVIALLASYVPARRATRIDPMAALRND
jgi:putative ABC transport system permease protein